MDDRPAGQWHAKGWLQRILPSDYDQARQAYMPRAFFELPKLSTLCVSCEKDESIQRFSDDWVLGWGMCERNVTIEDTILRRFMERTKSVMDLAGKLNPGEFY